MINGKKIIMSDDYGFCFGVKRAIRELKKTKGQAYTLGPVIHNPQVVDYFKKKGIRPIDRLSKKIKPGKLFIRAHGVSDQKKEQAKKMGFEIFDLTCPFVKKAQILAKKLEKQGYQVVILGLKNHPETKAIAENLKNPIILQNHKCSSLNKNKIGVICQTTSNIKNTKKILNKIKKTAQEVKIYNTICQATKKRQKAAHKMARQSDIVIVIGGRYSSNTKKLKQVCQEYGPTYHIETEKELKKKWFKNKKTIGITAGASTPDWIINKVVKKIKEINS
ncbi:MAG: 4-hydroxy-3-methylbut-2-enyl diphosphate reductase [Patescibacteria group bacterium]|nr:4-hydroxy-3-methylbut-2-enyl diphosphate reductase [Patescibacteria group bacterium]